MPGQPDSASGYPTAAQLPPYRQPAAPMEFPPQTLAAYGPEPNRTYAELTPTPRTTGQLIGATFRLFGKRLGPLLALAAIVSAVPSIFIGILEAILSALSGINPLAGTPSPLDTFQQALNGTNATPANQRHAIRARRCYLTALTRRDRAHPGRWSVEPGCADHRRA